MATYVVGLTLCGLLSARLSGEEVTEGAYGTGLGAEQQQANGETRGPNIVVFLIDDMGIMDTSVPFLLDGDGHPVRYPLNDKYRTPAMERMAAQGIRFSQFYAMSVCSPSRISIMTGQNAARHRTTNWINPDANNAGPNGPATWNWRGLSRSSLTLARILQSNGYRTIHVGKGHFGPRGTEGEDPLNLGFDINVGGSSIGQPGSYFGTKNYGASGPKPTHAVPGLDSYFGTEVFLTEALTLEAKRHVAEAVRENKRFFLNVCHYAVHAPFQQDPRYTSEGVWPSKDAAAFASLVEGIDKSLGDMLDYLDELGVAEETLVFFMGDNGSDAPLGGAHEVASSAPLRGRKGSHYEGGMRVPLIAAWAKPTGGNAWQRSQPIAKGAIQSQVSAIYDIFPTILEIAGITRPKEHVLDGQSLSTLMRGEYDPDHRSDFLMHYPHSPHRSDYFTVYRQGDWKLIYHYLPNRKDGMARYQLFDLNKDPFEQNDLAIEEMDKVRSMIGFMKRRLDDESALLPMERASGELLVPQYPDE
ncbi:MAG: sulfatase [Planctomycetes bacterium]|nr:sulfatase [Planctomycetota bacterium]